MIEVLSGGEPLMWDMNILTKELKKNKNSVHLETSGAHDISGKWDWICLSPNEHYFYSFLILLSRYSYPTSMAHHHLTPLSYLINHNLLLYCFKPHALNICWN
jgi:hypothetical protein